MFGFLASGAVLALFLAWASLSLIVDAVKVVYYGLGTLALLVARACLRSRRARASQRTSASSGHQIAMQHVQPGHEASH